MKKHNQKKAHTKGNKKVVVKISAGLKKDMKKLNDIVAKGDIEIAKAKKKKNIVMAGLVAGATGLGYAIGAQSNSKKVSAPVMAIGYGVSALIGWGIGELAGKIISKKKEEKVPVKKNKKAA